MAEATTQGTDVSRRTVLKFAGAGLAASALSLLDVAGPAPVRAAMAATTTTRPPIQFDIGATLAPPVNIDGTVFGFGPVYTLFLTIRLNRNPTLTDKTTFTKALASIEAWYPNSPAGVYVHVAYGIPYFNRLPGGMTGSVVAPRMPKLLTDRTRFALEEAVPGPSDIHPSNPGVSKRFFRVPVAIEANDMLITLRSDTLSKLLEVQAWLQGSNQLNAVFVRSPNFGGLITITTARVMFGGPGMPRRIADTNNLPYASRINPDSPMWMGFADQVASAFGPPAICTFQGNKSAKFTDTIAGDYFFNGSIQVLNHNILDLDAFYLVDDAGEFGADLAYLERVQYMYTASTPRSFGYDDQFTNGGGPTFLNNTYLGPNDARAGAAAGGWLPGPGGPVQVPTHPVLGHTSCLHRSSRAADGTPIHIRVDGPGFDELDVPDGSKQPKLHFSAFVPTADHFRRMRINQAAVDLTAEFKVEPGDVGLEPRITATRRQNFLAPARAKRSFPLLELV
jgi:hypothetical protein